MKQISQARAEVLSAMKAMPSEFVAAADAINRVTTDSVVSDVLVPQFANSAMDGFAVRAADVIDVPTTLTVVEDVPAGSVPTKTVGVGEATRIMTGAPMPSGADAVVMVEETSSSDGSVAINASVSPGTSVRDAGSDVKPGDVIVGSGVRLTPRDVAALSSVGSRPAVARKPTVAIMSTGDEVRPSDTPDLAPGKIRDTNRPLLRAALGELPVDVIDLGIISDDIDHLRSAYRSAAADADIIVSTGGVSMGDFDYVKHVLGDLGSVQFWKVAMQPAKPFAFGNVNGVPLFGLPGNPVSTFVAFEQFLRPALLRMMGAKALLRSRVTGTIGEDVQTNPEKEVFLRVLLADDHGTYVALKAGGQGSNVLSSLAAADAFAVVPVGTGSLSAGDPVTLEMFTWPESRGVDE